MASSAVVGEMGLIRLLAEVMVHYDLGCNTHSHTGSPEEYMQKRLTISFSVFLEACNLF